MQCSPAGTPPLVGAGAGGVAVLVSVESAWPGGDAEASAVASSGGDDVDAALRSAAPLRKLNSSVDGTSLNSPAAT